jgi:uncharacterized protein YkwD
MHLPSHRVPRRRTAALRGWWLAIGLTALAGLLAGGYLAGGYLAGHRARPAVAATRPGARSCPAVRSGASCGPASQRPHRGKGSPAASHRTAAPHRGHKRRSPPPKQPTPTPPPTPAASSGSADARAAAGVLAVINQARARAGLRAYSVTSGLLASAGRHDRLMAGGCGLSHQCPGEPPLGDRETAAGVRWTTAGENIGEGGPVPDTAAAITRMAVILTQDMLGEKPPDDGHRRNLLSPAFGHIGIVIYRDSRGTVWMTQDFSN